MKKIQTISLALLLLVIALAITVTSTNGQTPTQTMTDKARNAPCADPWINIAFQQLGYGTPGGFSNIGDCNTALYNNGSWNN
ncbi:MAG TPA: hypothetical protein PKY82_26265, partial [Pyrinomonadaceae bacterium]|nr:hypothetical protein [Pyrinomonadaceae bacterium]